jgi:TonB-linked SusC/RagA family outer membrane protein
MQINHNILVHICLTLNPCVSMTKMRTNQFSEIPLTIRKILLIMKMITFFLIIGTLASSASTYSQVKMIDLKIKNSKMEEIFQTIENSSEFIFIYDANLMKSIEKKSISVQSKKIEEILTQLFEGSDVSYLIDDRQVFIYKKENPPEFVQLKEDTFSIVQPLQKKITGTVTDVKGQPMVGVTVAIQGTSLGTFTDATGSFTLNVPPDAKTLTIRYVGMKAQEMDITDKSAVSVIMEEELFGINEVVVTALGIEKETRTLSYNVQKIDAGNALATHDANFINSLNGKVAGVTINSSSAGTGSSSRVVMRGIKSINGNNNVLYVIDGIPMQNNIRGQAEDIYSGAGQTGDGISNINPEDIESISILSGPSAAALYGSSAANGVILVTTKKGQKDKLDISVTNSTTFSNPLLLPKFQNSYGVSEVGSYYSWGDKLVTPSTYRPADFFQTGVNSTTSLTLSTGTEKNQTYISLGNVFSTGIIHNNDYNRYNFSARNTSVFLNGKMNLDVGFMASLVDEQNMIAQGQYFNPLIAIYLFPSGDDFTKVKSFERYDPSRNLMTQYWPSGDNGFMMQNPYWVTERDLFQNKKDRYMTNLSLKYNISDWLNISGRVKIDKDNEKAEKKFAASTNTLFASENGYYSLNSFDTRQIYSEGLVNINKTFMDIFKLTAVLGTSIEDILSNQYMFGGKLQGVANLFTYANVNKSTSEMSQSGYHRQKQSVFGSAQIGFMNKAYLDVTARNDWASTMAGSGNKSFFYPSVGLSGIITELLSVKSDIMPFLKLRVSYSAVGNEPGVFLTIPTYSLAGGYPVTQTRMPNENLKPELTKSWEAGLNSAFFKGAIRIDATVYNSRTYNQFFEPTLSSASGFTSVIVNAGRVDNKGIEITASYSNTFGNLDWSSYLTYSLNRNKIVQLLPGWTNPVTGEIVSLHELDMTGTGSYKMVLKEGGSMGDIYVNTLRTDEHGVIYVDPGSQTVVAEPNKFVFAGNNNPKYNIGWGNNLKWKGIDLSFLFAARIGGIVVSNTQAIMDSFGASKASADARDAGGAVVNGRLIPARQYYQVVGAGASGGIASMYCYSATNVRLGELSLGYDIPVNKWIKYIKSTNVSIIGRNLLLLYSNAPFDPELTANTQTYYQGIDYFMMPSLRSLGFSVKVKF